MNKIKVGDTVFVRSGKYRTKSGTVEKIANDRIFVSEINKVKKHQKKSEINPQGGIIEKTLSIHISNVMLIDSKTKKPSRVRIKQSGKTKVREYIKSSEEVVSQKESK